MKADLRFCGICWAGTDGIRLHRCDLPLGHAGDHRCHCGVILKGPLKLAVASVESAKESPHA